MTPFTKRVLEIIQGIPEGQVMTYGQIAGLAGSPRGARQVVRILHSSSGKYGLPWHRVVNARGEIAVRQEEGRMLQMLYLRDEGVEVDDSGQLDLDRWRFIPHGE
ncbi:methylated-DNA-protein-cysteine methyltransferase related protein [Paenibacillus tianmuensis]|uniref:Methylated-DNA-protein-cysteine methyltransferase related protein n=1 Tax=Paenibacillus tianmuensis TaxID=624147 RepID=A0A1G4SB06_9BACL|nr:MGMT family protein [Paenibacillus tianmuensis]SCW65569.1 methylated-DNA-protein-cysteine methyltransferase related protein [Paenibacillus tianmuensis]